MFRAGLVWRLEGGYSHFLEGSRVELELEEGPLGQTLDLSPLGLAHRSKPMDLRFRVAKGFRGRAPGGLRWRLSPRGLIRSRILFPGNAFLGNFRVPRGRFAVQWDIDASVEGTVGRRVKRFLIHFEKGERLHHTWVQTFPEKRSLIEGLEKAWRDYRNLLDPADVFEMPDFQVVRWGWSGRVEIGMDVEWGLGVGWVIPGTIPLAQLRKEVTAGGGVTARFQVVEQGSFVLRVVRRKGKIDFILRRGREQTRRGAFSAGVSLADPIRLNRLGPRRLAALRIVSALSRPLIKKANQAFEQALVRRLEIALAVEKTRWKRRKDVLRAVWSRPRSGQFKHTYSQLLEGEFPRPSPLVRISGSFERVRGRRFVIDFNILNWLRLGRSREEQKKQSVSVTPDGRVLLETTEVLEKSGYHWDETQFFRLVWRETTSGGQPVAKFTWTYGREQKFSRERLRQIFAMALHCGIVEQYRLPPVSAFPLKAQVLFITRFSRQGLAKVRRAGRGRRWEALVRALELSEPQRYGKKNVLSGLDRCPCTPRQNRQGSGPGSSRDRLSRRWPQPV